MTSSLDFRQNMRVDVHLSVQCGCQGLIHCITPIFFIPFLDCDWRGGSANQITLQMRCQPWLDLT
jgi:hypothetical protein